MPAEIKFFDPEDAILDELGLIAYGAYHRSAYPGHPELVRSWRGLSPEQRHSWTLAACAARNARI